MHFRARVTPGIASFDVTPMVDVTMLLIIFFMLTSQFEQAARRPLPLPIEKGGPVVDGGAHVTVIDVLGPADYVINGERRDLETIATIIASDNARLSQRGERTDVVVRGGRDQSAGPLNELALRLAAAGVRDWRLATQPESP